MDISADGLIFACVLDGRGGASGLEASQVDQRPPEGGTVWLHMDYQDESVRQWLYGHSGLDEHLCDALLDEDTRPRHLADGGGTLVTLRGMNFNAGSDPEDMVAVRVWIEPGRIISLLHRKVYSVHDIREMLGRRRGPEDHCDFVVMLADRMTERMGDIIEEVDERVDDLEDSIISGRRHELSELREELSALRRKVISMRRYIAPQRDMLLRLYSDRHTVFDERQSARLREVAEITARYVEDMDSARDRAAITHEELSSRLTEQMNRNMYLLSIVAAIFLPLGLITGLLGINVGGIPGTQSRWAFGIVCIVLVVLAVLEYFLFKRKRML